MKLTFGHRSHGIAALKFSDEQAQENQGPLVWKVYSKKMNSTWKLLAMLQINKYNLP